MPKSAHARLNWDMVCRAGAGATGMGIAMSSRWIRLGLMAAATAVLAGQPGPVEADWLRGQQLKAQCELDATRSDWTFCQGWAAAVRDPLQMTGAVCAPDDVEYPALSKIVLKYLREHEDALHQNSFVLTARALKEAYPCPEKTH